MNPLSATTLAPVMIEAAGLARKATTRAISSGVPNRPFGIAFRVASCIFWFVLLIISQAPPSK